MKIFSCLLLFCCSLFASDEEFLKAEWNAFLSQHPCLVQFPADEVAILAGQWGKKVGSKLGVTDGIREIDASVIEQLLPILQRCEVKIFMRHGEQQKSAPVVKLPAAEQKIVMTSLPENLENSLTKASLAELMEGMIVWEYLRQKSGRAFVIETSINRRAELPALSLGLAMKTKVTNNPVLNCINYRNLPKEEILKVLPDGTLPWEKEKVDYVVGKGCFDQITLNMERLLGYSCPDIYMAVTHTQQINAIATREELPAIRLGNFGFIILSCCQKELFAEGFYKKK